MRAITALALFVLCTVRSYAIHTKSGDDIVISSPVHEDLYIGGGNVTINAPVYGDLVIAGGTVIINDTVHNDLIIGGGNVTINGYVKDDIRGAGGELFMNGSAGDDVVIVGGTIKVSPETIVYGSVAAAGGTLLINGDIKGDLDCTGGEISLNGVIGKNANCRGGTLKINGTIYGTSVLSAEDIAIGKNAAFHNNVRYWDSDKKVDFRSSVQNGTATYDEDLEITGDKWQYLGFATFLGVLWYLTAAFIFIVLVQYLFGKTMKKAAETAFQNTLASIGTGLLFFVAVPVASVVVMVTVIGIPLGLLALTLYGMLILFINIVMAVVLSNWLNSRRGGRRNLWGISFVALGLFVLLKIISMVLLVGWLVIFILACFIWGGVLKSINWKQNRQIPVTE